MRMKWRIDAHAHTPAAQAAAIMPPTCITRPTQLLCTCPLRCHALLSTLFCTAPRQASFMPLHEQLKALRVLTVAPSRKYAACIEEHVDEASGQQVRTPVHMKAGTVAAQGYV